jgi:hypothetical protein
MENVLWSSDVMFEKWKLWLSVLSARKKSVLLRRPGRWLAEKTRMAREQNSQLDSISVAEKPSDQC